jgi:hypothetical protein
MSRVPVGRPSKFEELKPKFEAAFSTGCTIREAALFAGCTEQGLQLYFVKYPEWKAHCMSLRDTPLLKARANVVKDLQKENVETSKWYLERKRKKEFSTRNEYTGEDGGGIVVNVLPYIDAEPKKQIESGTITAVIEDDEGNEK